MTTYQDRVRGALLGGAVGDALGWPVEFERLDRIRDRFGPAGVTGLNGTDVTDDTQMTLFTAEGLLRGGHPAALKQAYQRWLLTQRLSGPEREPDGWLLGHSFLYASRAPGNACLSGLSGWPRYEKAAPLGEVGPINGNSKGCGTVMRSAPFGLLRLGVADAFELAAECAQLTHGHPTGYLAAGAFAALVERLAGGAAPRDAVADTIEQTAGRPAAGECVEALRRAVRIADEGPGSAEAVERVGLGWIAEECLAIAVYALLAGADAREALLLSVNHSGDSDSTGAVCGNLAGAAYGLAGLPAEWTDAVEGRATLLQVADDLAAVAGGTDPAELGGRYPAWA
ncbi:ADP-ribosylglycohydrolase family protein [Kitasatospora sp. NPDC048540]|uniref:ADP-ribosylglycohydrolase family protein n=1 Tax=unclassified Kitasatospora TaxID=2633591 RepID=UPI0011EA6411|nr:ADP-ribosylglycohydrolase family protein [Kitasatospora sp. MBT63]